MLATGAAAGLRHCQLLLFRCLRQPHPSLNPSNEAIGVNLLIGFARAAVTTIDSGPSLDRGGTSTDGSEGLGWRHDTADEEFLSPVQTSQRLRSVVESLLAVGLGGAIGAICRWGVLVAAGSSNAASATVAINVLGSMFLGVLVGRRPRISRRQRYLQGTGFAGGFTTFSSYALQVAEQLEEGNLMIAAVEGIATPLLAVLAAGLGFRLGRLV